MVNFLIFVQKNVSTIRFQEIKIRPFRDFEKKAFFSLFLMRKRLSSGQKWFLRPYFPLIRGTFLLRSGLWFSFRALEVPEPRVRKTQFFLLKYFFSIRRVFRTHVWFVWLHFFAKKCHSILFQSYLLNCQVWSPVPMLLIGPGLVPFTKPSEEVRCQVSASSSYLEKFTREMVIDWNENVKTFCDLYLITLFRNPK